MKNAYVNSIIRVIINALLLAWLMMVVIAGIQRYAFFNADTYPTVFRVVTLHNFSFDDLKTFRRFCSTPIQMVKTQKQLRIQCGDWWPFVSVLILNHNIPTSMQKFVS